MNYTTYGSSVTTSLILQDGVESHDDNRKGTYVLLLTGMIGRPAWREAVNASARQLFLVHRLVQKVVCANRRISEGLWQVAK